MNGLTTVHCGIYASEFHIRTQKYNVYVFYYTEIECVVFVL